MQSNSTTLSSADVWVTYKSSHPSHFYYIGKSSLRRIEAGYKGSGPKFNCVLHHPGFEPHTWTTKILSTHETETEAYLAEALAVPLSLLTDPFCLNTTPGGKSRCYGSPYGKLLKTFRTSRPKKVTPKKSKLPKGISPTSCALGGKIK